MLDVLRCVVVLCFVVWTLWKCEKQTDTSREGQTEVEDFWGEADVGGVCAGGGVVEEGLRGVVGGAALGAAEARGADEAGERDGSKDEVRREVARVRRAALREVREVARAVRGRSHGVHLVCTGAGRGSVKWAGVAKRSGRKKREDTPSHAQHAHRNVRRSNNNFVDKKNERGRKGRKKKRDFGGKEGRTDCVVVGVVIV